MFFKKNYQDQDFPELSLKIGGPPVHSSIVSAIRLGKSDPEVRTVSALSVRQAQSPRVKTRAVLAAVASGNSSLSFGEEEAGNDEVSH